MSSMNLRSVGIASKAAYHAHRVWESAELSDPFTAREQMLQCEKAVEECARLAPLTLAHQSSLASLETAKAGFQRALEASR